MSEIELDDEPSRWFEGEPLRRIDLASLLDEESSRVGRSDFNFTAWVAAAGGVATIIGGVVVFGLAVAWVLRLLA